MRGFFHVNSHGEPMAKAVAGRLFVSMTNEGQVYVSYSASGTYGGG